MKGIQILIGLYILILPTLQTFLREKVRKKVNTVYQAPMCKIVE